MGSVSLCLLVGETNDVQISSGETFRPKRDATTPSSVVLQDKSLIDNYCNNTMLLGPLTYSFNPNYSWNSAFRNLTRHLCCHWKTTKVCQWRTAVQRLHPPTSSHLCLSSGTQKKVTDWNKKVRSMFNSSESYEVYLSCDVNYEWHECMPIINLGKLL